MQENKESVIKEFLSKLKENKELNEKLQTKIISLKDVQNESKAKDVFLKELVTSAKILGYILEKKDFENYFNSQNTELSDDILEQASGGRGNFWSWVAVGLGTVAGGIGMIAGAFPGVGGSSGGGSSSKKVSTANRPAYVQQIDTNRNRSKSFDRTTDNTGADEQNKNADQKISELNKNTSNRRISSNAQKKNLNLGRPRRSSTPGRFAVKRGEQSPNIKTIKTGESETEAKTAEKKGSEGLLRNALSLAKINRKDDKKENNKDTKKDNKAVKNIKKVVAENKEAEKEEKKAPAIKKEDEKVDAEKQKKLGQLKTLGEKTEKIKDKLTKLDESISESSGGWQDLSKAEEQHLNDFVTNMNELETIKKDVDSLCKELGIKEDKNATLESIKGVLAGGDETSYGKKLEKINKYLKDKADEAKVPKKEKKEEKKGEKKGDYSELKTVEEVDKKIDEESKKGKKKVDNDIIKALRERKLNLLQEKYKKEEEALKKVKGDFDDEKDDVKKVEEKFPELKKASKAVTKTLGNIVKVAVELSDDKNKGTANIYISNYKKQLEQATEKVGEIKTKYQDAYDNAVDELEKEKAVVDQEKEDLEKTDVDKIPIGQLMEKSTKSAELAKKYEQIATKAKEALDEKIVSNFQKTSGVDSDGITKIKAECEKLVGKYTENFDTLSEEEQKNNVVFQCQKKIEEKLGQFKDKAKQAVIDITKEGGEFKKLEEIMTKAGVAFKDEKNEETKKEKAKAYNDAYSEVIKDLTKKQNAVKDYADALDQAGKEKTEASGLLKTVNNKIEEVEKSKITDETIKNQEYEKLKKDYDEKLKVVEQKKKEIDEKIKETGKEKDDLSKLLVSINSLKSMIEQYKMYINTYVRQVLTEMKGLKRDDAKKLKEEFDKQVKVEEYDATLAQLYDSIFLEKIHEILSKKYVKDLVNEGPAMEKSLKEVEEKEKAGELTLLVVEEAINNVEKCLEAQEKVLGDYEKFYEEYGGEDKNKKDLSVTIRNKKQDMQDLKHQLEELNSKAKVLYFKEEYEKFGFQETLSKITRTGDNVERVQSIFKEFNKKGAKELYGEAKENYDDMAEDEKKNNKGVWLELIVKEYEAIKNKVEQISAQNKKSQEELQKQKKVATDFVNSKLKKRDIVSILKDVSSLESKDKAEKAAEKAKEQLNNLIKEINSFEEKISQNKSLSENQKEEVKDILKVYLQNLGRDKDVEEVFVQATGTLVSETINFFGATDIGTVERVLASNSNDDKYDLLKKINLKDLNKNVTKVENFINNLEALRDRSKLNDLGLLEKNEKSFGVAKDFLKQLSNLPKKAPLTDVAFCTPKNQETDVHKKAGSYYKTVSDFLQKKEKDSGSKLISLLASDSTKKEVKAARENVLLGYLEKGTNKAEVEGYIYIYSQGSEGRKNETEVLYKLLEIRDKAYSKGKERDDAIKFLQNIENKTGGTFLEKNFANYILSTNGSLKMT